MKNLILFLVALSIFSCSTVKKQTQLKESQVSNNVSTENTNSQTKKNTDVQSQSNVETNSTTITFFNPNEVSDYDKILAKMRENNEPYSDIGIPKSITNSNTKQQDTQAAKVAESNNTSVSKANNSSLQAYKEEKTVTVSEPFWLKYKWHIIIGGIIVIGIGIFAIKNKWVKLI